MAHEIVSSSSIPEMFFRRVEIAPGREALRYKRDGRWIPISWKEYGRNVRCLATALADWVAPGEVACILSENRPEWVYADLAVLSLGGADAGIYPTNPPRDIAYIINDCAAKVVFVSDERQLDKILALRREGEIPGLEKIVTFDPPPSGSDCYHIADLIREGAAGDQEVVDRRIAEVDREALATLIYTSGTTGEPKGVMLTHGNLLSNLEAAEEIVAETGLASELGRTLSFLPLCHSFERTIGHGLSIACGMVMAFAESIEKLVDNLPEVRPTLLVSVPRIYEKVHAAIMEKARSGVQGAIIRWSLDVGGRRALLEREGGTPPLTLKLMDAVASRLFFGKVQAKLGGQLQYAVSGAAPLAPEIMEFLEAIGLVVLEGYGLTETSPILTANTPSRRKIGSVGRPVKGVEIRLDTEEGREGEGEILARGPNIMRGYWNKPEATAEVLQDGWFRTGDIGFVDDEGYLFITDRKKELLKTAGGKYVAPQPIENALKLSPLVDQAVVIGDRRKFVSCLIVPNFEALERHLATPLPDDLSRLDRFPEVRILFQEMVDRVNADRGRWEQIKKFVILPAALSQETGELTPTLKVKRRIVNEKYEEQIDRLYE